MKLFVRLLLPLLVGCSGECHAVDEQSTVKVEGTVFTDAVESFAAELTEVDLIRLRSNCEDVSQFHLTLGLQIRNQYKLWDTNRELTIWFERQGVKHPDSMSEVILIAVACVDRQDWSDPSPIIERYLIDSLEYRETFCANSEGDTRLRCIELGYLEPDNAKP